MTCSVLRSGRYVRGIFSLVLILSFAAQFSRSQETPPPNPAGVLTPPGPGTFPPASTAPAETSNQLKNSAPGSAAMPGGATTPTTEVPVPVTATPEAGLLSPDISAESLQKQIETLEKDESLDTANKDQALQAYRAALEGLAKITTYQNRLQKNRSLLEKIPEEAARLQQQLEQLPAEFERGVNEQSEMKEVEQAVTLAESELREFESERSRAEQVSIQRPVQRKQLIESQATLPARLKEVQDRIAAAPDTAISATVQKAQLAQNLVQQAVLRMEADVFKEELNRFDLEKNSRFNAIDLELQTRKVALQRKKLDILQQLLTKKKKDEAQAQLQKLKEQDRSRTYPVLQSEIAEIQKYTEQIGQLAEANQRAQDQLNSVTTLLEEVSQDEQDAETKDASDAGHSSAFALSLLRQLYELPDIESYREDIHEQVAEMNEATFQQIELRSQSRNLINLEKTIDQAIEQIKQELQTNDLGFFEQGLRSNLRELLNQKRKTIEDLESIYSNYLDTLTELVATQSSLVKTVDRYRDFIRKRIFWIRSDQFIGLGDLKNILNTQQYPLSLKEIGELFPALLTDFREHLLVNILGFIIWLLMVLLRVQAGKELTLLAEQVRKSHNANILPTLRAILLTGVITAPGPMLFWFLGWRLGSTETTTPFQVAFSATMMQLGIIYGAMEFFRQLCRRNGVVDAHFEGPNVAATRFRRDFLWLMALLLPLFFVVALLNSLTTDQDRLPLERVLFCVGMVICSLFAQRMFKPDGALMREIFLMRQAGVISRSRWVWYPLITLAPVVLAVMAWLGYYYTATQLGLRLLQTMLLLGVTLFLWALGLRWYRLAQRWFRIYVLRERLRKPIEETQTLEGHRIALEQEAQLKDQEREKQTLKLINYGMLIPLFFGLWAIWADVLPAIAYIDEYKLWGSYVQQDVEGPDGLITTRTVNEPVTPIDLSLAIFIGIIMIFLSRNMPGMVDFVLLQRLGIDTSLRYAITSVIGYLLTFIGITYVFGKLGFRWEQIQWLAAALTFGLSFGLQEIFANFVSGLIILFERPIRIGDIVTIEGVTGVVSKIRIRASTITDWDRKEFLVPNKELVTGRVLNWTLTDKLNRFEIRIGVAYGSDTERVRQVLFEILKTEPELLENPGPMVVFDGFGDSALNFVVRAFLPTLENRMETIHRLNTKIHKRCMEEGIEIAFPQQDLHIRSVPEHWRTPSAPVQNGSPETTAEASTSTDQNETTGERGT